MLSTEFSSITSHHFSSIKVLRGINTSSEPGFNTSSAATRPNTNSRNGTFSSPPSM